jgi:hypothetical protein
MRDEKPMTGEELGRELLEAVRQMKAGKFGRVTIVEESTALAAGARRKTGLSQVDFARILGSPCAPCRSGSKAGASLPARRKPCCSSQ